MRLSELMLHGGGASSHDRLQDVSKESLRIRRLARNAADNEEVVTTWNLNPYHQKLRAMTSWITRLWGRIPFLPATLERAPALPTRLFRHISCSIVQYLN